MLRPDGYRNGTRTPFCALPTRRSAASWTSIFRFMWQTGSGTQSNMNIKEVLSNYAIQLLGGKIGSKSPVHLNDDVNMRQSSNDTFPTAMHIAAVLELEGHLLPQAGALAKAIEAKSGEWKDVVKIGQTHLQDAAPPTVGQEWSGWAHQIRDALTRIRTS